MLSRFHRVINLRTVNQSAVNQRNAHQKNVNQKKANQKKANQRMTKQRTAKSLKKQQYGASLIEFMIASLVGVIAIGMIGSIFIQGQKLATERGKDLLLLQSLSSTLQQIKEDAQRAGYNGSEGSSLVLSGASSVLHADNDLLAYVFKNTSGEYQHVAYKFVSSANSLQFCDSVSSAQYTLSDVQNLTCYDLFEPTQITVSNVSLTQYELNNTGVSSAITTINVFATLTNDTSVTRGVQIDIKSRNWQ
ncbi:pilus assembly protein PilW [Vibrio sp.]|nr:pilus assembly protein PilW [Vibrio sp.]